MIPKVSVGFRKLPDSELDNFANNVIRAMTGNANFPAPPVTIAALQAALDDFIAKCAAARGGAFVDTAAKNNSRRELVEMLRRFAGYVQIHCNNDLAVLLTSGFEAHSTNRAPAPLDQPQGVVIKHGVSGQLIVSVNRVKNTRMYEARIKTDDGDWAPSVFSSDSRRIAFEGLTPGVVYTVQVRSLGGSTGQSDWSDPTSRMAV